MTNHDAITKACDIILAITELPAGVSVYPLSRKKDALGDCIVVNTLGVPMDVLQVGILNVNVHVKDAYGLPNIRRIKDIAEHVRQAFSDHVPDQGTYIEFEANNEQVFQEPDNEHVLNMRYKVIMLNN